MVNVVHCTETHKGNINVSILMQDIGIIAIGYVDFRFYIDSKGEGGSGFVH